MKKYTPKRPGGGRPPRRWPSVTSASAADLGGNCCADLEERIAELEATTARKGNRKVQPHDLGLGRRAGHVVG